MRLRCAWLIPLVLAGCAHRGSGRAVLPGSVDEGDWIPFYSRDFQPIRLDYFYDRSRIRRHGNRVVARWKVLGTRDGETTTTLYVIALNCRRATVTERGTVLIDAQGRSRKLPRAELLTGWPIVSGTSSEVFRDNFCPNR